MNSDYYFSAIIACLSALFAWTFGEFNGAFKILAAMVILDQFTGLLKAGVKGSWSSDIGFKGIARKVMIFILVAIANLIEAELLGHAEPLRDTVIYFYVINEGLSIIENAIEMGAPVPEWLKKRFAAWKDKHSEGK